jgi:hypothetical protein
MINLTFAALAAIGTINLAEPMPSPVPTPLILSRCPKDDMTRCFSAQKAQTHPKVVVNPVDNPPRATIRPRISFTHRW